MDAGEAMTLWYPACGSSALACLTDNQVAAFFAQGRSGKVAAQVDAHTAECERCRRLIAEYAKISAAQTAQTHRDEAWRSGDGGASSLGAGRASAEERADLVHRLAQANARKYVGTLVKGKWQIEELLGTGGMAHVFAARHRNGRRVAIKCMRPELMLERQFVQRFLREGYVANTIEHPGAVAVLDDDVMDDGTPFLVMELLVGRTLRERLEEEGPLPLSGALDAIAQVLDLLAVAHEKGIVHRDLKPDNLFETESGAIKVLDFGIARLKERTRPEFETRSGTTMGTVGYMPPEQARGLTAQVDARSDVWAVGATLHALLTGRSVHEAATTNEALLLAMTTPVPPMSTVLPMLPPPVQIFLDTALAFDRDRRYRDARAMKDALEEAVREAGTAATLAVPVVRAPAAGAGALIGAAATEVQPAQPSATLLDQAFTQPEELGRPPRSRGRRALAWAAIGGVVATAAAAVTVMQTSAPTSAAPAPAESAPPPPVASTGAAISEPALPSNVVSAAPVDASGPAATTGRGEPPPAASVEATPASSARGARPPARPKTSAPPRGTGTVAPAPVDTRDPLGPRN